jgi:hypothetical protein
VPTACRVEVSTVRCGDGCGGLRCAVCGGCSLRGGPTCRVGHAGCSSLLDEMFGREEPATMMLVDFQPEIRPFVRWLFAAGRLPEVGSSYQGDIARKTQPPRPNGGLRLRGGAPKWARKRVCTMCTPWA